MNIFCSREVAASSKGWELIQPIASVVRPWAAVQPDKHVLPMCYRKQVVVQQRPFPDEAHDDFFSVGTMDEFPQPLSRGSIRAWRAIAARRAPP